MKPLSRWINASQFKKTTHFGKTFESGFLQPGDSYLLHMIWGPLGLSV